MTKGKKLRSALITSAVSLCACVAMLAGSTYAWFTDSITSGNNVITAGNLDIEAYAYALDLTNTSSTAYSVNDIDMYFSSTAQNLESDGAIIEETNWEPGCSNAKLITVKNVGSLSAKIKLSFSTSGDLEGALWFDFIQVSEGSVTGTYTQNAMTNLSAYASNYVEAIDSCDSVSFIFYYGMYESAGNEYQGESFNASVTILAIQNTKESDGFGSDYDKGAVFYDENTGYYYNSDNELVTADGETPTTVSTASDLSTALTDGATVMLASDVEADSTITVEQGVDATIYLNGYSLSNDDGVSADTITVEDGATLTICGTGTIDNVTHGKATINNSGSVVINGGTYTRSAEAGSSSTNNGGNSYYTVLNHGDMTINGGTFENAGCYSSMIDNGYFEPTDNTSGEEVTLTINGGTFIGGLYNVKNDDYGVLVINDGTFENTDGKNILNWNKATINGGTFSSDGRSIENYSNEESSVGQLTIAGGTITAGTVVLFNYATVEIVGGELTGGSGYYVIQNYSSATISGGTINGTVILLNYGDTTISGGEMTSADGYFAIRNYSSIAINGGTINCTAVCYNVYDSSYTCSLAVTGGTLNYSASYAFRSDASGLITYNVSGYTLTETQVEGKNYYHSTISVSE